MEIVELITCFSLSANPKPSLGLRIRAVYSCGQAETQRFKAESFYWVAVDELMGILGLGFRVSGSSYHNEYICRK